MTTTTGSKPRRTIRAAEVVAGCVLAVKVIEGGIKLIPPQSGWTPEPVALPLSYLSWALLLVGVLLWLRSAAQQLEKVDDIARQLDSVSHELARTERLARYASGGVWVAKLLDFEQRLSEAHCRAGGLTLSHLLLEVFTDKAKEFHDLTRGDQKHLSLKEHHVVDRFLLNLMKALPPGSAWMGISLLQNPEAWESRDYHAEFNEFQALVETRTKDQEINFLRLWDFRDEAHFRQMEPILSRQADSGLKLRYVTTRDEDQLEDVSLIWVPLRPMKKAPLLKDLNNPVAEMQERRFDFKALCGISFRVPSERELDQMTLYLPETVEFRELCIKFQKGWERASNFAATATKHKPGEKPQKTSGADAPANQSESRPALPASTDERDQRPPSPRQ